MSEMIAGWTFGGIWLTATLWAALDAEARGRNPIVWGFLTFVFGPFALGAYAITGDRDATSSPAGRKRTYYFTAAFFFLGVAYASLVALVAVALDAGVSQHPIDSDDARVATAILLALLVFAMPLWAFHWVQTLGLLETTVSEREDRMLFLTARRYGAVVLVLGGLVSIGFGIFLVFSLFAAVMGVFDGSRDQFLPVLAFLPMTGLIMAYHYFAIFQSAHYRALAQRFESMEPPPAAEAVAGGAE
jgi:hypothetical protein